MPLTLEDIKKSLETAEGQEVLSVLIEKATKSLVDENTTLKAGLEVINKREEERSEEILKSAVNSYSGLGLDEEKDLALFKAVAKTGPKHFARFKEVLELAKSSLENADLLSPEGNDDNTETLAKEDADSGLPKEIQCKVEEFQKADGSLTFPQAVAKALGRGE